jgi:hypothetical protein
MKFPPIHYRNINKVWKLNWLSSFKFNSTPRCNMDSSRKNHMGHFTSHTCYQYSYVERNAKLKMIFQLENTCIIVWNIWKFPTNKLVHRKETITQNWPFLIWEIMWNISHRYVALFLGIIKILSRRQLHFGHVGIFNFIPRQIKWSEDGCNDSTVMFGCICILRHSTFPMRPRNKKWVSRK